MWTTFGSDKTALHIIQLTKQSIFFKETFGKRAVLRRGPKAFKIVQFNAAGFFLYVVMWNRLPAQITSR